MYIQIKNKKAYIKNVYILLGKFRLTHLKVKLKQIILKMNLDIYKKKAIKLKTDYTHEKYQYARKFLKRSRIHGVLNEETFS